MKTTGEKPTEDTAGGGVVDSVVSDVPSQYVNQLKQAQQLDMREHCVDGGIFNGM